MVQTLLGIAHPLRPVDAADAAALALCHLAHAPMRGARGPGGGPMIGSLRGTLLDRGDAEVTVEVGGVGYRVVGQPHHGGVARRRRRRGLLLGPPPPARGRRHPLRLRHQGRAHRASRRSSAPTASARRWRWRSCRSTRRSRSARVVADDDVGALCLVPGVGKKTAAAPADRAQVAPVDPRPRRRARARRRRGPATDGPASARADVRDALAGLGYADDEIRDVMADLPDDGDAGALLRDALQRLAAARR